MIGRRGFFRLIAGAAAIAVAPKVALASPCEVIWCDGVNDDAPGISALIRGETVQFMNQEHAKRIRWDGDTLLMDGDFTIHTPVRIGPEFNGKTIRGGQYRYSCITVFNASGASGFSFEDMWFSVG